ncbi:MAG: DUF4065 domain-containing protein [Bacteroidota bacterium]|nr:DUF4065 domain-containing protein [Bacteroidota bacterium]
MGTGIFTAAHYLCRQSGWQLSNLKLQKLLYFAQMVALGRFGEEILKEDFQAWALGPVNEALYHEAKFFGSRPVETLHPVAGQFLPDLHRAILDQALESLGDKSVGELILISHWPKGAWAKHYKRGEKGRVIPKKDIAAEYLDRAGKKDSPVDAES